MTPVVRRVDTCSRCKSTDGLIRDDGPVILCRSCVRIRGRLSTTAKSPVQLEHENREGQWDVS